jgi:hypothetical protein
MHPIFRHEQFVTWLHSRPWRPNLALLVIYAVLFCLAVTQHQVVTCKCNFGPIFVEEIYRQNYAILLFLLSGFYFLISPRMTTRFRQVLSVCVFTLVGVAFIPIASESARQEAPKFGWGNEIHDVTF